MKLEDYDMSQFKNAAQGTAFEDAVWQEKRSKLFLHKCRTVRGKERDQYRSMWE